jgi:hypothetical protein
VGEHQEPDPQAAEPEQDQAPVAAPAGRRRGGHGHRQRTGRDRADHDQVPHRRAEHQVQRRHHRQQHQCPRRGQQRQQHHGHPTPNLPGGRLGVEIVHIVQIGSPPS